VGGRALTKHCHRALSGWWGQNQGTEKQKNATANVVLQRFLQQAAWINLHSLPPHGLLVYEIRVEEGYGARWSADGLFFRGFLEPQVAEGHEQGWIHQ